MMENTVPTIDVKWEASNSVVSFTVANLKLCSHVYWQENYINITTFNVQDWRD